MEESQELSNEELKNSLRKILIAQDVLTNQLISHLAGSGEGPPAAESIIADTIILMIQSMGVSIRSILKLTEGFDMSIKDCFGIARQVAELATNICFIASSDAEVAQRARQHGLQKSYRDLSRSYEKAGIKMSLSRNKIPSISEVDGLREALETFTNSKGNEIREWTGHSLDYRIEKVSSISKRAALSLSGAVMPIYRNSSEFLHGTYASTLYFWSDPFAPVPTLDKSNFQERWTKNHLVTIFTASFFSAAAVIETCSRKFDISGIDTSQRSLEAITLKLMQKM